MTRRRRAILGWALALAALWALAWPLVWDAILSGLLLAQVVSPQATGPLTRITDTPERESVTFRGAGRDVAATLYRPQGSGRGAGPGVGVILVHGVNETGKDDPRIVWVADLLARAGFVVLTPDFTGFKSLTLRASDIEEIAASVRYLDARMPGKGPDKVGLVA